MNEMEMLLIALLVLAWLTPKVFCSATLNKRKVIARLCVTATLITQAQITEYTLEYEQVNVKSIQNGQSNLCWLLTYGT